MKKELSIEEHYAMSMRAFFMAASIIVMGFLLGVSVPYLVSLTLSDNRVDAVSVSPVVEAPRPISIVHTSVSLPLLTNEQSNSGIVVYLVKKGDTLTHISRRHCATVEEIATTNAIKHPDKIYVGQKLSLLMKREGCTSPVVMAKQFVSPEKFTASGGASPEKHLVSSGPGKLRTSPSSAAPVVTTEVFYTDCPTILATGRISTKQTAPRSRILECIEKEYGDIIREAAQAARLPASLVKAVLYVESKGRITAVSKTGCLGLMQLLRSTAKEYRVAEDKLFDPRENIFGGARVLADYLHRFSRGDLVTALVSYNLGPEGFRKAVREGLVPHEHPYARSVLGIHRHIEKF